MNAFVEGSLLFHLAQVSDPRGRRGRQHPLSAVLGLACCAILCGARSFKAIGEWAQNHDLEFMHRLGFTRLPIGAGGIRKVLIALGPVALEDALTAWVRHVLGPLAVPVAAVPVAAAPVAAAPMGVSLDGKSARGSFDGLRQAVHLLSLVAHQSGLTLAQTPVPDGVEDKTNEHKAALPLLKRLALEGMVVTGDAMFCHRDICETILAQKGDYFLFVKENQPTLLEDIKAAMAPSPGLFPPRQQQIWQAERDEATTCEKGHGRNERRTLRSTTALNDYLDWPGVAQVGEIEATVRTGKGTSTEKRYFITSVPRSRADALQLLSYGRGHWAIENRSHYVRDVTMGEDKSRVRKGAGPQVMAALRNAAIGFLRTRHVQNIAEALRRNAARVDELFTNLGIL